MSTTHILQVGELVWINFFYFWTKWIWQSNEHWTWKKSNKNIYLCSAVITIIIINSPPTFPLTMAWLGTLQKRISQKRTKGMNLKTFSFLDWVHARHVPYVYTVHYLKNSIVSINLLNWLNLTQKTYTHHLFLFELFLSLWPHLVRCWNIYSRDHPYATIFPHMEHYQNLLLTKSSIFSSKTNSITLN